jgi:hypothetical protein
MRRRSLNQSAIYDELIREVYLAGKSGIGQSELVKSIGCDRTSIYRAGLAAKAKGEVTTISKGKRTSYYPGEKSVAIRPLERSYLEGRHLEKLSSIRYAKSQSQSGHLKLGCRPRR